MAPRAAPAESSKAARQRLAKPNGAAVSAVRPSKPVKRRAAEVEEESEDEGLMGNGALEMSDDEDVADEEEEDDDDEEFPELDSGSEGSEDGDADSEELEDSEAEEEDEDEDEEGYNSSDIDAMDSDDDDDADSATPITPGSTTSALPISTDEKLSKLIAKHSIKPNDAIGTDGKISLSKDGKGRLVKSKYVDGSYIREYDDYEAGYGSESSTEEVRHPSYELGSLGLTSRGMVV